MPFRALERMTRADGMTGTLYFQQQVTEIEAAVFEILREPLRAFGLFPTTITPDNGAQALAWSTYDEYGQAKIVGDFADDLPRVDRDAKHHTTPYRIIGNSYGYSLDEIRAAMMAGVSLERDKADTAARAHREAWNRAAFYGAKMFNLPGLLINDDIVVDNTALTLDFATQDAAIASMMKLVAFVRAEQIKNIDVAKPNTLVLPPSIFGPVMTMTRSATSDVTIGEYIKTITDITEIEEAPEISRDSRVANLKPADDIYSQTKDVIFCYRKDKSVLELKIPGAFEQLPPQARNFEFVVPCRSKVGGLIIKRPKTILGKGNITVTV